MAINPAWNGFPDQHVNCEVDECPSHEYQRTDASSFRSPIYCVSGQACGRLLPASDTHSHGLSSISTAVEAKSAIEGEDQSSNTADKGRRQRRSFSRARAWPPSGPSVLNYSHIEDQPGSEPRNSAYRPYRLQRWLVESPGGGTCPWIGTRRTVTLAVSGAVDDDIMSGLGIAPATDEMHIGATLAVERMNNELRSTGAWCVDIVG